MVALITITLDPASHPRAQPLSSRVRDAGSVLLNHYSPLRDLLARTACVASRQGRYTPCNVLPGRAQHGKPQSHLGLKVTRFGEVPRLSNFDNLFEGPNVRDARSCGQNTK